jgi:hypothetical protein
VLAQAGGAGVWEAVPEPMVGRVLQFNVRKVSLQAEIVSNEAGMRSQRSYVPKQANVFRIVCLGDSMVMGTAGKEEDRWGDQIEQILRAADIRVAGNEVEVYSLGIGSWSALNEVSYLSHRVSSYAPDLVLVMMTENDLDDTGGVMGIGAVSFGFTSEHRSDGSGVLASHWPLRFGIDDSNLLYAGFGSESRSRWGDAFREWKRLETLLEQSGGRMVFGVLRGSPLFVELAKHYYSLSGMQSPFIVTDYFGERLAHDAHPNRAGHRILAVHYLQVLASLGWLPLDATGLPALHPQLSTTAHHASDPATLAARQEDIASLVLRNEIDFDRLSREDVRALLGGIYPGSEDLPLRAYPYASVKSVFLLGRKAGARRVTVEVDVPNHVELYPFELEMYLDGEFAGRLTLESQQDAGRHILKGAIPATPGSSPAVEVLFRTRSYWAGITDFTMRSFRLIAARQE